MVIGIPRTALTTSLALVPTWAALTLVTIFVCFLFLRLWLLLPARLSAILEGVPSSRCILTTVEIFSSPAGFFVSRRFFAVVLKAFPMRLSTIFLFLVACSCLSSAFVGFGLSLLFEESIEFVFNAFVFFLFDCMRTIENAITQYRAAITLSCKSDNLKPMIIVIHGFTNSFQSLIASSTPQKGLKISRIHSKSTCAFFHGIAMLSKCHETGCTVTVENCMETTARGILH
mmetsp:Transcript_6516/g.15836  ORF Transcript_6516/g.15836 Transcript_6516/m.15836 type:complete len:230 (+) Transcript_6516:383-1072(+)